MKKIIPFKKEIKMDTSVSEIVSISLDHSLSKEEYAIKGTFIVSGEYKLTEASINTESFKYELPFTVAMDEKYVLDNATIDIDDFYYEIINNNILGVNIDVVVDGLDERIINEIEERCIEKESFEEEKMTEEIDNNEDRYQSYTVYIVREGDTIEEIIEKYQTNKEILLDYNNLNEIKIGDKIIIPC